VGVGRPRTRRTDRLGRRLREELPCPSCKVWVDERELGGYGLVGGWAVAARRFVTRVRLEPRTESPRVGVGFAAEDAILVGFVGGRLQASSRCAGRRKLTQKYASARKADGRQGRDQRPSRLNRWWYPPGERSCCGSRATSCSIRSRPMRPSRRRSSGESRSSAISRAIRFESPAGTYRAPSPASTRVSCRSKATKGRPCPMYSMPFTRVSSG